VASVRLRGVTKAFGNVQVLHGVDLDVAEREFVVFVGPSGCGKSTLLRIIAGLEQPTGGTVEIDGRDVTRVDPADRGVSMVFQSYALYPHMTVRDNIGFGLRMNRVPKAEIAARIARAAEILQLEPLLDRKPAQLSGGQRQRVAIGRAIVREPKVFLFDEPLSNLDAALRVQMRVEIAKLHTTLGATMIYVTHDQVEAMTLADRIMVLNQGRVEQIGSPLELYRRPRNLFVASFIGSPQMNLLPARMLGAGPAGVTVAGPGGASVTVPVAVDGVAEGAALTFGVRPQDLRCDGTAVPQPAYVAEGRVEVVEHLGDATYCYLSLVDGAGLMATAAGDAAIQVGDRVTAAAPAAACQLFDAGGVALARLG
jgi:multiple sugar transport system ATP-binding protein